jgi:hypothetical protein
MARQTAACLDRGCVSMLHAVDVCAGKRGRISDNGVHAPGKYRRDDQDTVSFPGGIFSCFIVWEHLLSFSLLLSSLTTGLQ